eukprot:GHVQ01031745.1.p1 GENE.GHVQ01031745.1~~GHVQ01031745.1.p1  ORF type:complete len:664 (-),score=100.62 GHVQ01031745.1:1197-3188(-)
MAERRLILLVCLLLIGVVAGVPSGQKKQIAPDMTCPKDYSKEGNECVRTIYQPPIANCPSGFEAASTGSSASQRDTYSASADRSSSRYDDQRSSRFYSSVGRSNNNKKKNVPAATSAVSIAYNEKNKGKNSSSEYGNESIAECVRTVTSPPRPYCPPGYEGRPRRGEDDCVKFIQGEIQLYCPPSYRLQQEMCIRTSQHNPSLQCADTFTLTGESCKRLIEMEPMEGCDDGYILEGDKCVKVEKTEPQRVCPRGSIPQGNVCVVSISQPLSGRTCPFDYTRIGDECVKQDIIRPDTHCVGDEIETDDGCLQQRILDVAWGCDEGFTWLAEMGKCIMERDPIPKCEEGTYNPRTEMCEFQEAVLPAITCPPEYEQTPNDECIRVDVIDFLAGSCPPGLIERGDQCISEDIVAPELQCPESFLLLDGMCMRPTFKNKWQKCQNGFNLVADECVTTEELAPSLICPDGYKLNMNMCVQKVAINPEERCDRNSEMRNGRCVEEIVTPSRKECEEPYKMNRITGLCEDEEVAPPDLRCPSGYKFDGDCVREERISATPRCPDNHHFDTYHNSCKANKRYVPVAPPQPPVVTPKKTYSHSYRSAPAAVPSKPAVVHHAVSSGKAMGSSGSTQYTSINRNPSSPSSFSYSHSSYQPVMGSASTYHHHTGF